MSKPDVGNVNDLDAALTIRSAGDHRRLLLDAMVAVTEGRMNVGQANAISSLSAEVHKSIKLEWDMICYAAETFVIGPGNQITLLGAAQNDDDGGE